MGSSTYVGVSLKVVPNGVTAAGRLRATLVVTPTQPAAGSQDLTLENWPDQVVGKIGGLLPGLMWRADENSAGKGLYAKLEAPSLDPPSRAKLAAMWLAAFNCAAPGQWAALLADIGDSASGQKQQVSGLSGAYPGKAENAADSLGNDGVLTTDDHDPTDRMKIAAVVPNPQAAYANATEAARASRVIRKLTCGPYENGDLTTPIDNDHQAAAANAAKADQNFDINKAKNDAYATRFKDMVTATDPSRAASKAVFDKTAAALKPTQAAAAGVVAAPASCAGPGARRAALAPFAPVAPPPAAVDGPPDYSPRGGHVYGAWPQRTKAFRSKKSHAAAGADDCPPADPSDAAALARAQSIYFTLSGDRVFSRLFGFAFDISFPKPDAIASGSRVQLGSQDSLFWCEGLYREEGAREAFWPAPRNYPGGCSPDVPQDELRDGVCRFDAQQYLTTLDVRGAVALAPDGKDYGGRHQTLGFTFLDGDAAARAARDLAVAQSQQAKVDPKHPSEVVLHAEELTTGRRVDVAVKPHDAWEWRTLTNRTVDYPQLPAEALPRLREVTKGWPRTAQGRLLDETAFQRISRAMPVLGAPPPTAADGPNPPKPTEAVVEEAYLSWDGTPLAALACRSDSNGTGCNPILPVSRVYDLPHGPDKVPLPPPLRYGVDYLFGMRAAFLGGGGPALDQALPLYQQPEFVLPHGAEAPAPKRFRRQEAIAAPLLLLPVSLVPNKAGPMGFEPPATATLRTVVPGDPPPPGASNADSPGPSYVEASRRATNDPDWRVFAAPMAGFDFCARHGVFDDPKTWDRLRAGGLRDVAFLDKVVKDPRTLKEHRQAGFPSAVVKRMSGFNADRTIYERKLGGVGVSGDADEAFGATVIASAPEAPRAPGRGYLPDPAATRMSLRARIAGSDIYLTGDVPVDLYDLAHGTAYPNAMPVALKIQKADGKRKTLAAKATDILVDKGVRRFTFTERGVEEAAKGVLSRYVEVTLYEGEQFDIEATCLPSDEVYARLFALPETIGVQLLAAKDDPDSAAKLVDCCGPTPVGALAGALGGLAAGTCRGIANFAVPADSSLEQIACRLIGCIRGQWPLTEIAGVVSLRVAHAISAPIDAPQLKGVEIARQDLPPVKDPQKDPGPLSQAPAPKPRADGQLDPIRFSSSPGAKQVILTGEIWVDLEQIDTFEIHAGAVAPGGKAIDDPKRGRGVLAKRAGRWPSIPVAPGKRTPLPARAVLGFDVDANGKTELPTEIVTLLRVQNLPDPRDAQHLIDRQTPGDAPIFLGTKGRWTRIDIGALYQAAVRGVLVQIPIATDGVPSKVSPRTISVTRPHEISDTRACNLALQAVGISRFAHSFDTAPLYEGEQGTEERLLTRRQSLRAWEQSKSTVVPTCVAAAATEAPVTPAAATPEIYFRFDRCAKAERDVVAQKLTRKCGVRLRFARGWFSSGEGERVGIVLWPPRYKDQASDDLAHNWVTIESAGQPRRIQLNDLTDADLGDGGPYVSRWGGDPIRKDATPETSWFIPPSAFAFLDPIETDEFVWPIGGPVRAHAPGFVASAFMPIKSGQSADAPLSWLEVSLLTFEPYFDVDAEEWFVDVPMSLCHSTDPFIRFGLVRYQENALTICSDGSAPPRLQVSTPVRVWTQLPPARNVTVKGQYDENSLLVTASIRGLASVGAKSLPSGAPSQSQRALAYPRMSLTIVYERQDALGVRRQIELHPLDASNNVCLCDNRNELEWVLTATIERKRLALLKSGQLFAWIKECEDRLPATYTDEPKTFDDAFSTAAIKNSGARFLARIPFATCE